MKNIEIKVLNPEVAANAEQLMVAMARLTQSGHKIQSMEDFEELIAKPYKETTAKAMIDLPHPTIQKFGVINIAIVGLSRRALGQITRHQNEVKFMSSSLQYSDYSGKSQYVVPYEVTKADTEGDMAMHHGIPDFYSKAYLATCRQATREYEESIKMGIPHDAASYQLPQGLRGVLLVSATPYQLKHMISQRSCSRNTLETQYIFLRMWEELYQLGLMFKESGPTCMYTDHCPEGKMFCGDFPVYANPTRWLDDAFQYIRRG